MTPEQKKTLKCVVKWFKICEREKYDIPRCSISFAVHAEKSSLLNRLLDGKRPYKFPPPKSFSYPWYELLEREYGSGWMDVSENKHAPGKLIVNQSSWTIIKKFSDKRYLVSYNEKEGSVWSIINTGATDSEIEEWKSKSHISRLSDKEIDKYIGERSSRLWTLSLIELGKNCLI